MYFESTLTEKDGGQSHDNHYLIEADDFDSALKKVKQYATDWYEDADVIYNKEEGCLSFFDGEVTLTVSDPVETTLEKYFERLQDTYLIK